MGCRILNGGDDGACFYCSTSGWAFGPVFSSYEKAEAFLTWLDTDPRELSQDDLKKAYDLWLVTGGEPDEDESSDDEPDPNDEDIEDE